jgi:long-chain fatty acid transport protein
MKKLTTLFFAGCTSGVFAGGFQINTQGPAATGMAGAFTGVANDASSVFYNPGGMAFNAKTSVLFGGSLIMPQSSFLSPYNGNVNKDKQLFSPFYVYGTYKINDNFSAGLGINTPFGLGTKWADNWEGKFITQEIKLAVIAIQPTLSYKINENLSVGAGFVFTNGSVAMRKAIPVSDAQNPYGAVELKGSGNGYGYNLGIMGKFGDKFSIGLNYRSSLNLILNDGDATFIHIPASLSGKFPPNAKFNSKIRLPNSLTMGIGYKAFSELLITAEIGFTGWSSYDTLALDFPNVSGLNNKSVKNYKDVFVYRLGGQYLIHEKLTIRAGVAYDTSPVQDGYLSPELPDANKLILSCGLTYNPTKNLGLSAYYTYENLQERNGINNAANFSGTYKTLVNIAGVGIHYNFN